MPNEFNSLMFVNGPSGGGKGVLTEVTEEELEKLGYKVLCVSCGDLFRNTPDAELKSIMNDGKFASSLGKITPGLIKVYNEHLANLKENNGKAVLILDGFVRVGKLEDGTPHQIEQIADVLHQVLLENDHPDTTIQEVMNGLRNEANHILVDVAPDDAIEQIKNRANREIDKINTTVMLALLHSLDSEDLDRELALEVKIINGLAQKNDTDVRYGNRQILYAFALAAHINNLVNMDTGDESKAEITGRINTLRNWIISQLNLDPNFQIPENTDFIDIFRYLGIDTRLRMDDLDPDSRESRVSKYIYETSEGIYEPGIAGVALQELGFSFDSIDGSAASTRENLIVIPNGKSRGVNLKEFQSRSAEVARMCYGELARTVEGRISKEIY